VLRRWPNRGTRRRRITFRWVVGNTHHENIGLFKAVVRLHPPTNCSISFSSVDYTEARLYIFGAIRTHGSIILTSVDSRVDTGPDLSWGPADCPLDLGNFRQPMEREVSILRCIIRGILPPAPLELLE
jgi:hypothetical protein